MMFMALNIKSLLLPLKSVDHSPVKVPISKDDADSLRSTEQVGIEHFSVSPENQGNQETLEEWKKT